SMLTMLGQPVTLGFVAEGGGDGPGGGGVGEGSGSSAARRALSQAGLVTGSRAARPLTPSLDDQPIADDWSRDLPAAPAIDFMGLALGGTTRLNLPEHLDDDFEYTVYTYTPEPERGLFGVKEPADKRGYFRVDIRAKRSLVKLPTMPKDVVFLVDTS